MEDNQKLMCIPKRVHSKVMEVFHAYDEIIVDILKDTSFNKYEIMMHDLEMEIPFGGDTWDLFKKHERTFTILAKRNIEILEFGGCGEKIVLPNNQYAKYINGLRKKKIGVIKDESVLDSSDRSYWNRQNIFKRIIEQNLLKVYTTGKGKYSYTTVNDILNFFSGSAQTESLLTGKELYENFLNENSEYDFHLTSDSIAKYINSIERCFQKKRIRYDGNRLNIYSMVNYMVISSE